MERAVDEVSDREANPSRGQERRFDALSAPLLDHFHTEGIMDFGKAIEALKSQKRVYREGWNGRGMWIVLMPRLELPPFNTQDTSRKVNDRTAKWIGEDTPLDCQPYIAMWTASQQWQPGWLPSQADLLAEDWVVLD